MKTYYIGLDWSQKNMAIARIEEGSSKVNTIDVRSNIRDLKDYLSVLKGKRILTFEETTTSQWLYTELKGSAEEIIVCDPYRNKLLKDGPKTDATDAEKLVRLLKANLLKPVFHTADDFIELRKFVSGYEDLVVSIVRSKNQRSALLRGEGKKKTEKECRSTNSNFVLKSIDSKIEFLTIQKQEYLEMFKSLEKKHRLIKILTTVPGIGTIGAVKIVAQVIQAERFKLVSHFWSYCGLVELQQISGGKIYGKKSPRFCRHLKHVFMAGAMACRNSEGVLGQYYRYLLDEKKLTESQTRKALARKIAAICLAVMKSKKAFNSGRIKCRPN